MDIKLNTLHIRIYTQKCYFRPDRRYIFKFDVLENEIKERFSYMNIEICYTNSIQAGLFTIFSSYTSGQYEKVLRGYLDLMDLQQDKYYDEMITEEYVIYPKHVELVHKEIYIKKIGLIDNVGSIYNQCDLYLCHGTNDQINKLFDDHLLQGY